jgi:hypothetical protein
MWPWSLRCRSMPIGMFPLGRPFSYGILGNIVWFGLRVFESPQERWDDEDRRPRRGLGQWRGWRRSPAMSRNSVRRRCACGRSSRSPQADCGP